jgi:caffeoyl-CoA O-methyltransferase
MADEIRRIEGTTGEVDTALASLDAEGAFVIRAHLAGADDLPALRTLAWEHRDALTRRCLGVVVVSDDDEVRAGVLAMAGTVGFPLTSLADAGAAAGWLAGQVAAGPFGARPAGGGRTVGMSARVSDYVDAHLNPGPDPIAHQLHAATIERFGPLSGMNIGEDQGRFFALLVELLDAKVVVEVGTFTGMSALWMARALPPGGRLTCFEVDPAPIEIARPAWESAGVADRIDVVLGPAADGLAALPDEPHVDLAFIDADKSGYATYVDLLLPRLRPGGLLALDNTLWSGAIADPRATDANTVALRDLNDALAARDDVDVLPLTIGDGVTLVRPRR